MLPEINEFETARQKIFDHVGYVEDWVVIPLDFQPNIYWYINGEENNGEVCFAETKDDLLDWEAGNYYSHTIYTQRFLPKWVYRGKSYTMIVVDTHTDGNKFLQIFDNDFEIDPNENN